MHSPYIAVVRTIAFEAVRTQLFGTRENGKIPSKTYLYTGYSYGDSDSRDDTKAKFAGINFLQAKKSFLSCFQVVANT